VSRYIAGTEQFTALANRMRTAGSEGQGLLKEMTKELRKGAAPLVKEARGNVGDLAVRGVRGGAAARSARARHTLRNRKKASDRLKTKAYRRSGLRTTVAKAVSAQVRTGRTSGWLRVRAAQAAMPPDQRKLPRYLNRGEWRHPVFGNEYKWVKQIAPPAWFDDAAKVQGPVIRGRALNAIDTYVEKLL
jgi:hypothetical protein